MKTVEYSKIKKVSRLAVSDLNKFKPLMQRTISFTLNRGASAFRHTQHIHDPPFKEIYFLSWEKGTWKQICKMLRYFWKTIQCSEERQKNARHIWSWLAQRSLRTVWQSVSLCRWCGSVGSFRRWPSACTGWDWVSAPREGGVQVSLRIKRSLSWTVVPVKCQ